MIEILTPAEIIRARETGTLVADILQAIKNRATVGTNLLDINRWAGYMIISAGASSCYIDYEPSFGRGPFGHYICTAVNDAVLHGKPYDYTLADGDLLTLDLAVIRGGVAADSAISFIVGDAKPLESVAMIDATERALYAGIAAAGPGARIGDISHAIGSDPDGWTLRSATGCRTAHSEHTIAITNDGAEILTLPGQALS